VKRLGSMDAEIASIIWHFALTYVRQRNMPLAVGGGAVAWGESPWLAYLLP